MKRVIVTDTHLGLYQDSDKWLDIVLQFFKDVVVYCHKHGIEEIIHLGDFFENRKSLNTKTQHVAHRIAKVLGIRGLHTKIIIGNHDCYFKNQLHPTSLELFTKYEHIEIIDHPMLAGGDILLVPWGLEALKESQLIEAKYCFGHFAIDGFHMNDSYVCKGGIPQTGFKNFDMVLSGHFHTPSKQGNIVYLGAPYGQTFHDVNGVRGFYTFEDGKLEFIEYIDINSKVPVFKKIRTDTYKDRLDEIEGNVVRLVFDRDYGTTENQQIEDEVLQRKPFAYSIDFTKIDNEELEVEEAKVENRREMVDSYIDLQPYPENIHVGTLKTMFYKIMDEAEQR